MNSKERVLLAVNHKEADRIPLFRPNVIDTYEPYDPSVVEFLQEFAFDRFANHFPLIRSPKAQKDLGNGDFIDGYGCKYKYMGVGIPYCTHSPLADAETIADIEAFDWPDPDEPDRLRPDAREIAIETRAKQDFAVTAGVSSIFHQYHHLRGFEQWMMDIKLNPGIYEAIASRLCHINKTLILRVLEEIGEFVDIVATNDDMGTSISSYMSVADFQTFVKPYYADIMSSVKSKYPHIKIYMHSHGQITTLLPDLIDCGLDIINPILPLDSMDSVVLKQEFGDDLCFHGGIDIEHIVPFGTVKDVRDHVKQTIDILAPGGGYIFALQAISPIIPPENIISAYELALEHGLYGA
jgi:uroporphyrinogen decarboxylase